MIATFTLNASVDRRYVMERCTPGAVNRVRECIPSAGGKGLNVARIIHALSHPVIAGGIAGGHLGESLCSMLSEEGIAQRFTRVQGETRCCINICDESTHRSTELLEPGLQVSPEELDRFWTDFDALSQQCSVLTFSGSLPGGVPPDMYAQMVRRAHEMGKRVLLDTSGNALALALDARPDYIKPNEDEIASLTGVHPQDEAGLIRAAQKLHRDGIAWVVVSRGSRGALMVCEEGVLCARPPAVEAANTVGCGDSMTAAFAIAMEKNLSCAQALRYAVAVSAASAMSAQTGSLSTTDFDRIYSDVQVQAQYTPEPPKQRSDVR